MSIMIDFYDQSQLEQIPNMSHHDAVQAYVTDGCYFNECIRNDDFGSKVDEKSCVDLQSLFKNITANKNMYVFRGVDKKYINDINKAFTSTSPDFKCARDFANNIIMHIHIPIGTVFKAIRISKDSEHTCDQNKCFDNEEEILFGCGTRFKPTSDHVIQDILKSKELTNITKSTSKPYTWLENNNIEIRFYTLVSDTNTYGGMMKSTIKKFIQVTGHPRRLMLRFSNKKKYILIAKQRVFLSDIRGKYRYVA